MPCFIGAADRRARHCPRCGRSAGIERVGRSQRRGLRARKAREHGLQHHERGRDHDERAAEPAQIWQK